MPWAFGCETERLANCAECNLNGLLSKQIVQNLERKRLADERKDQLLMEREIDQNTKLKMASLVNKHERTMGVLRERTQEQRQLYANRERENIQLVAESHRRLKQQYKS